MAADNISSMDATVPENCFSPDTLEMMPKIVQTILAVLYGLIMTGSVIGNFPVIWLQLTSLLRVRTKSRNISKYLLSLAVSDVLNGGFMVPFHSADIVFGEWWAPRAWCSTVQYVVLACVFNTSLTLALLAVERLLATIYPLSRFYETILRFNTLSIISIWLLSFAYAWIPFHYTTSQEFTVKNGDVHVQCITDYSPNPAMGNAFAICNFVVTFLLPIVTLSYSYWRISQLLKSTYRVNAAEHNQRGDEAYEMRRMPLENQDSTIEADIRRAIGTAMSSARKKRSVKLLIWLVITHLICWSPIKVYQLLTHFKILKYCSQLSSYFFFYLYIAINMLALCNSVVNPILYSFLSVNFWKDFKNSFNICNFNWPVMGHCAPKNVMFNRQTVVEFIENLRLNDI